MTNKEYVRLALRTEAPVTDVMRSRFTNYRATSALIFRLMVLRRLGTDLDHIKRNLFYGTELKMDGETGLDINVIRLLNPNVIRLLHAATGLITETAELLGPVLDYLFQRVHSIDVVNLREEAGDLLWYQAILSDVLEQPLDIAEVRNIAKLAKRYPERFTEDKALNRDLEAERRELERGE